MTKKTAKPKARSKPKAAKKAMGQTPKAKAKTKPRTGTKTGAGAQTKTGSNLLLTTLALSAAGVLGYLGWDFYKSRKGISAGGPKAKIGKDAASFLPSSASSFHKATNPDTTGTSKKKPAYANDAAGDFPLKKGSKGEAVKKLQKALIAKYGASILPKYGADGDFGSETAKALAKAGLPAEVSESAYNVLVKGAGSADHTALAEKLHEAAQDGNFSATLSLLKEIEHKDDYEAVSEAFKDYRLSGVRKTLVTGLLDSFNTDNQKQQLRYEFLRMGLQYDGKKWSLSGFGGITLITKEPATVWVNADKSIEVPAKMVLGNEVGKKLDFTLFENNGKYFLVRTSAVKQLR